MPGPLSYSHTRFVLLLVCGLKKNTLALLAEMTWMYGRAVVMHIKMKHSKQVFLVVHTQVESPAVLQRLPTHSTEFLKPSLVNVLWRFVHLHHNIIHDF